MERLTEVQYLSNGKLHNGIIISNDKCVKHSPVIQVLRMKGEELCEDHIDLIEKTAIIEKRGRWENEEEINALISRHHEVSENQYEISQGDIYFADLPNVGGSIQSGYRPVVVVTNSDKLQDSDLVQVVTCTTKNKKTLPTHLPMKIFKDTIILCETEMSIPKALLKKKVGRVSDNMKMKIFDKIQVQFQIHDFVA